MDWPRFQLTTEEAKYSSKYDDPRKAQTHVLRRMYYNELNITPQRRTDSVTFQISRRARVVGMTFAGDIDHFELEVVDVSGEQYTAGPMHVPLLCNGWIQDPRSANAIGTAAAAAGDDDVFVVSPSLGPYVFEPNIVVRPNQTIQFNATPKDPDDTTFSYLLGMTLHVVEFPGMPGSPL